MPPSESLIALAREQDALCRAVVDMMVGVARVVITARAGTLGKLHEARVQLTAGGATWCGHAEHLEAETAVREAYTALLRHVVRATPCTYVAAA